MSRTPTHQALSEANLNDEVARETVNSKTKTGLKANSGKIIDLDTAIKQQKSI